MAVTIDVKKDHLLILTDQDTFDEKEANSAVNQLKQMQEHRELLVFDFSKCTVVTMGALRALTRSLSTLAHYEGKVVVVAGKDICKMIRDQGLERLFECHASISEVVGAADTGAGRQKALEFLNTTLEAVIYTLQVSTNTKAEAGKTFLRAQGVEELPQAEIAAAVGLVSAPFTGSLILGFPTSTYLGIMSRLLGEEYKEITPEIKDGAAELLNIILGQVKISLNEKGFAIKQAIPTVVHGDNMSVLPSSPRPSVIVPYSTDVGDFYIELTTNPEKPSSSGSPSKRGA